MYFTCARTRQTRFRFLLFHFDRKVAFEVGLLGLVEQLNSYWADFSNFLGSYLRTSRPPVVSGFLPISFRLSAKLFYKRRRSPARTSVARVVAAGR